MRTMTVRGDLVMQQNVGLSVTTSTRDVWICANLKDIEYIMYKHACSSFFVKKKMYTEYPLKQ